MNYERSKKIKSQKIAAIVLIMVPLMKLISYLHKTDFDLFDINNYVSCSALVGLIMCGGIGLKNDLRKQRALKI